MLITNSPVSTGLPGVWNLIGNTPILPLYFTEQDLTIWADGFVPNFLKHAPLDGIVKISSEAARGLMCRLSREWGLLVGTSSGANVAAALQAALETTATGAVATLSFNRAERYYSTALFENSAPEWASTAKI